MKKIIQISLLLFFTLVFNSCKKDVPTGKTSYIGEWSSSDGTTTIIIEADGSGAYDYDNGAVTKYIHGKVKFTSAGFDIKASIVKKRFTVDQAPTQLTSGSSSNYSSIAKFNGQNYYKY